MTTQEKKTITSLPAYYEFLLGGLSGVSGWAFVHPLDTIKTRMQISGEGTKSREYSSTGQFVRQLVKKEGFLTLYRGFSAAVIRQCTYTTIRLGIYNSIKGNFLPPRNPVTGKQPEIPLSGKVLSASIAGLFASIITCPVEVCLIRMQADGRIEDPKLRRNYKHVFDALFRIANEEGLRTYWRGATPTVTRAIVVCTTQLVSYDQAKDVLLRTKKFNQNSIYLHILSSLFSGVFYSFCSLPFDIAKTRMQNQVVQADGTFKYKNIFQSLVRVVSDEGIRSLWKGYFPYFLRCGGHTIGMFVFLEQYKILALWALNK